MGTNLHNNTFQIFKKKKYNNIKINFTKTKEIKQKKSNIMTILL